MSTLRVGTRGNVREGARGSLRMGATGTGGRTVYRPAGGQRGSVLVWLPTLLVATTLLAVVVIGLGGHLVAISRAATIADSAALAAVSVDASPGSETPREAAARVVEAGRGRLESCDCRPGARRAGVRVSVPVPGVVWPRLGATRQGAEAEAVLQTTVPPVDGGSEGWPATPGP